MDSVPAARSALVVLVALATISLASAPASAVLVVTDGAFSSPVVADGFTSGGVVNNWYDDSLNLEFSSFIFHSTAQVAGSTSQVLALGPQSGWVYQSLGTKEAGDDNLTVTLDAHERIANFRYFADTEIDLYAGAFGSAADGVDIDASLTSLGTISVTATSLGFSTPTSGGDGEFVLGANVGSINIAAVPVGTEMWIRISKVQPGGDIFATYIDNLSVTTSASVVPAPAALPAGLALMGVVAVRHRRTK